MKGERHSGISLRACQCVLAGLASLTTIAGEARADYWKFTYTSDLHGELGHFLVDQTDFTNYIGETIASNFLNNSHIASQSFDYNGMTWTTADIATAGTTGVPDYTIFDITTGPIPYVQSGVNYLALNDLNQYIWLDGNNSLNIDGEYVSGNWTTTSTAVPEPATLALLGIGSTLITMRRR